jgi:hypothetical protein
VDGKTFFGDDPKAETNIKIEWELRIKPARSSKTLQV